MTIAVEPCADWIDETWWDAQSGDDGCMICSASWAKISQWVSFSTYVLFMLSGRQFTGVCSSGPIRPPNDQLFFGVDRTGSPGRLWARQWNDLGSFRPFVDWSPERGGPAPMGGVPEIEVGTPNLVSVTSCKVDGVSLVAGVDFRIDDNRWLVRLGGKNWPVTQDMTLPSDRPGTFEVEITFGVAPPEIGKLSSAILACEMWKAKCGDKSCRLPSRVQSLTRQGTNLVMINPSDFLQNHRTSIPEVNMFLDAANPGNLIEPAQIFSPDIQPVRRPGPQS